MIKIKQGEDYRKVLVFQYADSLEYVDLSGVTAFSEMRDKPNGTLAATGTCTVIAGRGEITALYDSAQTAEIEPGEYGFDIWVVDSDEEKHPVYEARVKVVGSYTDMGGE